MNIKSIRSISSPAPIGPYSQAIAANGLLFISGQVAIDGRVGTMVQSSIEAETHQVMKNIGFILHEAGIDFNSVLKVSIFVRDLNNFATINTIYGSYMGAVLPARETIEVSRLPRDANVEISCIALMPVTPDQKQAEPENLK
ncbi:MAG: Rid family detoxifying hydrolase [Bacteroidota bacterium]